MLPLWAGNEEEWHTISLSIDHQIPSATAVEHSSQGIALVELFAMDSGSGIERIEYAADGGETATYLEPLSFTVEGIHSVQYRALDRAGLYNPWQTIQTWVKPYNPSAGSTDFEEDSSGNELETYRPTHEAMPLYDYADAPSGTSREKARNLPRYTWMGEAILLKEGARGTAGEELLSYYAIKDSVSYAFVKKGAAVPGWSFVAGGIELNEAFFPGGADLYMKRVKAGGRMSLPGEAALETAPLLITVEDRPPTVRIAQPRLETVDERRSSEEDERLGRHRDRWTFGDRWDDERSEGGQPSYPPLGSLILRASIKDRGQSRAGLYREEWSWKVRGESDESALILPEDGLSLPWTEGSLELELRLRLIEPDGRVSFDGRKTIRVENRSSFRFISPVDGERLITGTSRALSWEARDASGVQTDEVSFQESRDGATWTAVTLERDRRFQLPEEAGAYQLKALWVVAAGKVREATIMLQLEERGGRR